MSMAAAAILLVAPEASAQIGAARQLTGSPVASEAVHARFVWGGTGGRIIWVNQADEVFFQRVTANTVQMHIRLRGHTVGHAGDPTEYVIPWGPAEILVVTQRGNLYRHTIRAESIGPPEQIQGAPVGTQGQDPVFMFRGPGNRLVNATRQGELWVHTVGATVSAPVRIGTVAMGTASVVRHAFAVNQRVYAIFDNGAVVSHDFHPNFGRATVVRTASLELARADTRFVWVNGNRLYATNAQGTLWAHDISALQPARGAAPQPTEGPPPTGE